MESSFYTLVLPSILFIVVMAIAGKAECAGKFQDSGMPFKYGFVSGCLVSTDKGKTFIPAENYRVER